MSSNLYFCIISLFYSFMLLIVFYKSKTDKTIQNSIFSKLILTNFIGIFIGFACYYTVLNNQSLPILNYIVSRLYLVYLLAWILLFTMYIYAISNKLYIKNKNYLNIKKILTILFLIATVLIFVFPLSYYNANGKVYSYGSSAKLVYVLSEILVLYCMYIMFKNIKKIGAEKYSSLFAYISGGIIVMLIQSSHPELLLMSSMEIFVTYIMYFTIENKISVVKTIKEKGKN